VHSRKILKYINLSIAVLLLAGVIVVYWIAYRPLPQVSGSISAPISQQATIVRDALGVPHITAGTWEDAIFLQGFVTAQDRLWQMDAMRRAAAGDLSEVFGTVGLEADRDARRFRFRRIAEAHYRALPASDRAVLVAYARGVNFFIETHRGSLPLEFTLNHYEPRPWSAVDSILAGLQMFRTLTFSWRDKTQKQAMLEGGDPAKVNFLFPSRTGSEIQPGSNAWAIAGTHTASGKPILASDPHLEFSAPAIWYTVHLKAPGLNVIGVSLPGVPCIVIGHNNRIAWGMTNLHYDVQDLYIETFDPQSGRYRFHGQTEQARLEHETIAIKGQRAETHTQWVTRHGPLARYDDKRYISLRWTAAEPGGFQFPFLDIDRAGNWAEFTTALKRFPGPGQNFVYADVDGNIGYQAAGMLPIRRNYDGDVPVDGSSGDFEWDGFIPFEQLPASYNPASGMIVTANQNPFPPDYPFRVHGSFAPHYRSSQIRALLSRHDRWKPADMLAIQKDVYSAFSNYLAHRVVEACDRRHVTNPDLTEAIAALRGWNGQMEKDLAAPMVVSLVYQHLRREVANVASPGKGGVYDIQMAPSVLQKIVESGGNGWFKDLDQTLVRCLSDGVAEGARSQGGSVRRWRYGRYNELTIRHPIGNNIPVFGRFFNIGPIEMSGSSTTVKQTTRRLGPSMRFVADLSNWDQSLHNLTIGESGQILSSHYKDQWNSYYSGTSFPMQFDKVDAKATLICTPLTEPRP
jgi:penicillin amidase